MQSLAAKQCPVHRGAAAWTAWAENNSAVTSSTAKINQSSNNSRLNGRWTTSLRTSLPIACSISLSAAQPHFCFPSLFSAFSNARRRYATSTQPHNGGDTDDWSSIEVELLTPELMPAAASSEAHHTDAKGSAGSAAASTSSIASVTLIDTVDTYAKAKVMNFVRRQQQQHQQQQTKPLGGSSSSSRGRDAGASSPSSSFSSAPPSSPSSASSCATSIPGMEIREVQGGHTPTTTSTIQYHARWRLPLPAEYGERFGEGFAPTVKEAENVAAMHAERVIDALGFPLFLLSSKQRKHAEAARAAGRWAPLPLSTSTDSKDTGTRISVAAAGAATAELVPPPDTPSPPPLRLVPVSARQQQERQLHIAHLRFTPVEKGMVAPLSCTLASPFYFDHTSVRRMQDFFRARRERLSRYLRFILLQGSGKPASAGSQPEQEDGHLYLAQLTLPLPPRFGLCVAMGRGPTKKDAATLACMHAELIIDASGTALYPSNAKLQAQHAEECARVGRWCAPPGDCDYRYSATFAAPLELVERLDSAAAAAARAFEPGGGTRSFHDAPREAYGGEKGSHIAGAAVSSSADIEVGATSSGSVESILVQHHRAVSAAQYFTNEVSMRDYESARLLLERYLEQFVPPSHPSPLQTFLFVEALGQRDRPIYRATITVPLAHAQTAPPSFSATTTATAPLPYTHSFVAMGVSDSTHVAELAASLHALRTLAVLNRLTLLHGSPSVRQALDSFALRAHLPPYVPTAPMLLPSDLAAETLPTPVRVMDGVVGRIATAGLTVEQKTARAQVFTPGAQVVSRRGTANAANETSEHPYVAKKHSREDFLLQELQQAREKLPRLLWDATADAQGRIVVAPDTDAKSVRRYAHTLGSVRSPDAEVSQRIRDYLERHGKSRELCYSTTRTRVSEDVQEGGVLYVTTLQLPVPDSQRRRHAASAGTTACSGGCVEEGREDLADDDAAKAQTPTQDTASSSPPDAATAGVLTCTAQGEAPTREEAFLLCNAHAELLLDALGVPLYDNQALQRKHADAARALGRWAPMTRGALMAPANLRPVPPPLRKVSASSALWAEVERQRRAAAVAGGGSTGTAGGPSAEASGSADGVNDEELCDLAHMRFVHPTEVFYNATRLACRYFTARGLDYYRNVRLYKVADPRYGTVHRAIVKVPVPPGLGPRYAVGLGDTNKLAQQLCAQHVLHILDALGIRVYNSVSAQRAYALKGAIKGVHTPTPDYGVASRNTPTPPGYYSLELSDAAVAAPPSVPARPTALKGPQAKLIWTTYVQRCVTYQQRWRAYQMNAAVQVLPTPQTPPSHVPVEDAAVLLIDAMPAERSAAQALKRAATAVGLANPIPESSNTETVRLTTEHRVFVTWGLLLGTPYTMRGVSADTPAASRNRAYLHGAQIVHLVTQRNNSRAPQQRRGWAEGPQRQSSLVDPVSGDITHRGRVLVLRMWCVLHSPPRALRLVMRVDDARAAASDGRQRVAVEGKEQNYVKGSRTADRGNTQTLRRTSSKEKTSIDVEDALVSCHASLAVVERRDALSSTEVFREVADVAGDRAPHPRHAAAAALQQVVHQLFYKLQRTPTMQALHRLMSQQPQLHVPSLRVLRNAETIAPQTLSPLLRSVSEATEGEAVVRPGNSLVCLIPPTLLSPAAEEWWTAGARYETWAVRVLTRWVRTHSFDKSHKSKNSNDEEAKGANGLHKRIPQTLLPFCVSCGLATEGHARGVDARAPQRRSSRGTCEPTPMAEALVMLCRCLPQLPPSEQLPPGERTAFVSSTGNLISRLPQWIVERDRTLPLQLAHLLYMGLLLDCVPWAARLVAMVACAEDTLAWYHFQTRDSSSGATTTAAEKQRAAVNETESLRSRASVDVVEAVLLSAAASSAPLPPSIGAYAREVLRRVLKLHNNVATHTAATATWDSLSKDTNGNADVRQMGICTDWLNSAAKIASSLSGDEDHAMWCPQLSFREVQTLRPLLQCAVATAAASHGVWLRDRKLEELEREHERCIEEEEEADHSNGALGERKKEEVTHRDALADDHQADHGGARWGASTTASDDEASCAPTSRELFVFQNRRSARWAVVEINGTDLTRMDGDTQHTLSSTSACFAAFGCEVLPVQPASRNDAAESETMPVEAHDGSPAHNEAGAANADATPLNESNSVNGMGLDDDACVTADDDVDARGMDGDNTDAPVDRASAYTQVLGTCASPLMAMLIRGTASPATRRSRAHTPPSSPPAVGAGGLRVLTDDVPILMAAFQDTVPLVVPYRPSATALQQVSQQLHSRVAQAVPFTPEERAALVRLFTLPVDELEADEGLTDA